MGDLFSVFSDEQIRRIYTPVDPRRNVRLSDPLTSWEAAASGGKGRINQRVRCLRDGLVPAGLEGLTDDELAISLGIPLNSTNKRRGELRDRGLVWDSGRRRQTRTGSSAIVWVVGESLAEHVRRIGLRPADTIDRGWIRIGLVLSSGPTLELNVQADTTAVTLDGSLLMRTEGAEDEPDPGDEDDELGAPIGPTITTYAPGTWTLYTYEDH